MSRRGKSLALKIVELFFDGLLFLCFIAQVFLLFCLLTYGHLPLPTSWADNTINGKLPGGISVSADSYALRLNGTIQIENARFELDGIEHAIFHAGYAHLQFDIGRSQKNLFSIKKCVLSDGRLLLPAVYAPSGKHSTILEQIALRLVPVDGGVVVDSFAAMHETIRLRGSIDWIAKSDSEKPLNARQKADAFFKQVANILTQKQRFEGLSHPTILFHVSSEKDNSVNIYSRLSSRAFDSDNLRAENLTVEAELSLNNQTLVTQSSVLLKAGSAELSSYNSRASNISAKVEREEWEALLQGEWPDMEMVAESLDIGEIRLESPRIKLSPRSFPNLTFSGFTSGLEGAVRFSGSVNADTRVAKLEAEGSIDLLSIAPENMIERLPVIKVNRPPYYNLNLDFNENFVLSSAKLRARIDVLEVEGINFDHIRFRSDYDDGRYSIDRLYLRRDWQWLDLGFSFNSTTKDYAIALKGFANPHDYNAILPRWWEGIFRDFDFQKVESGLGDFVIYGNSKQKAADFFFGHAFARNVGYQGVRVDEGELFVRGRGPYAEVYRLNARSGEGFARGDIRFTSRLDEVRGPVSVRLDLETKLPLPDAKKLFDENIASILSDFETDALPETTLKGVIFNSAYPEYDGLSHIDISASCPLPISFKGIPLDYLNFDLKGRKEITYLRNMDFGYADGEARADADIMTEGDGPAQTRFLLSLQSARQDQAISHLTRIKNGEKQVSDDRESAADQGRLDLELHVMGSLGNLLQLNGFGSLEIQNDALYAIQLFGPLSKLLYNIKLGFTSFALNEMKARFSLKQGTVYFQQLEINGPRSRIEAPGTMQLDDFSLAMRVSVYLLGNAGNPESRIRKFGDLFTSPIPNLLEFELTGTPENQKWRSLYDPRKFIPLF